MRGLKYKRRQVSRAWMATLLGSIGGAMTALRRAAERGQAHRVKLARNSAGDLNSLLFVMLAQAESAGITQQLLKLSRRELAGTENIDLNEAVRETTELLRYRNGRHVTYRLGLDANLGTVRANSQQMRQVVMNLVTNACESMPGGGTIAIETRNAVSEPAVVLSVTDTGSGIGPEAQARLFEPFFTTRKRKGAGLGLTVAQRIVSNAGGTIQVESELGKGTTFIVQIPA